jgi:hypothetical protein
MALFNKFVRLLSEVNWNCTGDASEGRIILTVTSSNGRHLVVIRTREESQIIIVLMPHRIGTSAMGH